MSSFRPIAIVGRGAVLPGAASLAEFWAMVRDGKHAIREVPNGRWIAEPARMVAPEGRPDAAFHTRAAYVDHVAVDFSQLNLPAGLPEGLDPLYAFALAAARQAWGEARVEGVDPVRAGVYLAAIALPTDGSSALSRAHFARKIAEQLGLSAASAPPSAWSRLVTSLPAALVAAALGLRGGAMTLDAACASSLYAIKLACDELNARRADVMLAGGVSRPECLYTQVGFSQLKALSPSGHCRPYDAAADGLLVGEGAAVFVLKRLDDALRAGDRIHAVIRGIGLSNDLAGSLLAADSEGQLRAMRAAYASAGWSPDDVQHIEGHGTGTPLGDAVELRSMRTLRDEADCRAPVVLGSVKSNIGHLLTGAGAAGLLKTMLAMEAGILPPTASFATSPGDWDLAKGPIRVLAAAEPWDRSVGGGPRRAAVSAFGFGGINAHLLLESPEQAEALATRTQVSVPSVARKSEPIAIVGIGVHAGTLAGRRAFQEALLGGTPAGTEIDEVELPVGQFRIPPAEIPQTLPQQLLALEVVAEALADAGIRGRQPRARAGAIVGINLDPNTLNFHHRWALPELARGWAAELGLELSDAEFEQWIAELREAAGPPLTAPRVLGALGSIAASRVAREFGFGGPSFSVSAEEAGGLRAVEIAGRALQQGELDLAVAAAVDLAGDERAVALRQQLAGEDGGPGGDAGVAIALKRLSDARREGDRVYAVIRGLGAASGQLGDGADVTAAALGNAYADAGCEPARIGLVAIGEWPIDDRGRLAELIGALRRSRAALASTAGRFGHCGAASGLLGMASAALALHAQMLPPWPGFERAASSDLLQEAGLYVPVSPQVWLRDRATEVRTAGVVAVTADGGAAAVLLEEDAESVAEETPARVQPAGARAPAIFAVAGDTIAALRDGLETVAKLAAGFGGHIERLARRWHQEGLELKGRLALAIVSSSVHELRPQIAQATLHLANRPDEPLNGRDGIYFAPRPLGEDGQVAWVFPGSGSHYVGMGRGLLAAFPQIARAQDATTESLRSQLQPERFFPQRADWSAGWPREAARKLAEDTAALIMGQVAFGIAAGEVLRSLGVRADAALGYSLGETTSLFALGAWPDRDEMHRRMRRSPLFRELLAGPCLAARRRWRLADDEPIEWRVAVVNRPAEEVRQVVIRSRRTYLLITNAPNECVIGGQRGDVEDALITLGCEAVELEGASTVHCPIVEAVAEEYRALHRLPTRPVEGVRFYSAARAAAYAVTEESAAESILAQALGGFDFCALVRRAYADGVRVFVEAGPGASGTRMIGKILANEPHAAVALTIAGQDEYATTLQAVAALVTHRVVRSLAPLYGMATECVEHQEKPKAKSASVRVPTRWRVGQVSRPAVRRAAAVAMPQEALVGAAAGSGGDSLGAVVAESGAAAAKAHEAFLRYAQAASASLASALRLQNRLLEWGAGAAGATELGPAGKPVPHPECEPVPRVAYSREMCLEFARGSAARVLGPEFAEVDTFPARVRLPDEPLMLVDRILEVTGVKGSLGGGTVVTEHDVLRDGWYLDGGRMPISLTVEAGQADLFLCAYLGIDLAVRGKRVYRLLDATVRFHRDLPAPGEVIRYDIRIDRFVRQGETYLFFFAFEGTIAGVPLLSMSGGCAGFFTAEEIANSGGIIETAEEMNPPPRRLPAGWRELAPFEGVESYDEVQLDALRRGDLATCFGEAFADLPLAKPVGLPTGKMRLVHRVVAIEPRGGRYGLGVLRAEADIHPDDWFLTCHFVDDMVMPGTLMYDCCVQTLRVFLMRMGWVAEANRVHYAPVPGVASTLRCRGPVTAATKVVTYEVHIKEMGYGPEPYAIADALMYADGDKIVRFTDMSLRMVGVGRADVEGLWGKIQADGSVATAPRPAIGDGEIPSGASPAIFEEGKILAFAVGRPSEAFGSLYEPFDERRRIARLPGPPFATLSRITRVEAAPWKLDASGWIEAQYDVRPDAWYFAASRQDALPFAILLETALQPCGWLAAYKGSALRSNQDLRFRNLGGEAVLLEELGRDAGVLTTRVRMTRVSEAAGMIIEDFDFELWAKGRPAYVGKTNFGFFADEALANQVGIRDAAGRAYVPTAAELRRSVRFDWPEAAPLTPDDTAVDPGDPSALPARAWRMLDEISVLVPDGGPAGLGFAKATKRVNPQEWFFAAHFYQDPVWPGSLGVEAFLQLLKVLALTRWPELAGTHRFTTLPLSLAHKWAYRGQVVPQNKLVEVEAVVTGVEEGPSPMLRADGCLKVDGVYIYAMNNFGVRMRPGDGEPRGREAG